MAQVGSVEPSLPYGGDFSFQQGGELVLVYDVPGNFAATQQRIQRVIESIPQLYGPSGLPINTADDIFNINFGSGLPAYVGENLTTNLELTITQNIVNSLKGDPGLSPTAIPVVQITNGPNYGSFFVTVIATDTTGATVIFPSELIGTL